MESPKSAARQANHLKSIKKMKNYAKYQKILMASSEKGQIGHGGQWEIDQSALKTHCSSGAYLEELYKYNKTNKPFQISQNDQKLCQVSEDVIDISWYLA